MKSSLYHVVSRVLIYQDKTLDYIARALELDLIGSGNSPNKALADLENAIKAQVSFALQKETPDMIYFKAEPQYEQRWLDAAKNNMRDLAAGDVAIGVKLIATVIKVEACIPKASGNKFSLMNATKEFACARA